MKKKYSFLVFFIAVVFILAFAKTGFSEYPWPPESSKPTKPAKTEEIKPDILMKLATKTPAALPSDFEDEFEEFQGFGGGEDVEFSDPIEPFNRFMWEINEYFYDYALEPVARGYIKITPEGFRKIVVNFFRNISSPIFLVSSILQGDKEKVGRTIGRFFINTTMGIGGLFDPASNRYKLKIINEDIDQALGYHGIPNGPFLMLPLLGPITLRGVVAKIPQIFLVPEFFFGIDIMPTIGARGLETVNKFSFRLDAKEDLDSFAIDPYTSVKDFYFQHQKVLIKE